MRKNQFYCVKCRKPCIPDNPKLGKDKNGRPRLYSKCPMCNSKVFRYVSMEDAQKKLKK